MKPATVRRSILIASTLLLGVLTTTWEARAEVGSGCSTPEVHQSGITGDDPYPWSSAPKFAIFGDDPNPFGAGPEVNVTGDDPDPFSLAPKCTVIGGDPDPFSRALGCTIIGDDPDPFTIVCRHTTITAPGDTLVDPEGASAGEEILSVVVDPVSGLVLVASAPNSGTGLQVVSTGFLGAE